MNPLNTTPYLPTIVFFFFTFIVYPNVVYLQTAPDTQNADQMYEAKSYHAAAELYEQSSVEDIAALEKLAHSYRLNHDTQNAEKYYAMIVGRSYDPINYLYYAQALQSNGKKEDAKKYFEKYDEVMSKSGDQRGGQKADQMEHPTKEQPTVHIYQLANLNSEAMDFSPTPYKNGMVFVSTRQSESLLVVETKTTDKWTGEDYSSLYFSDNQGNGVFSQPNLFSLELNGQYHEGPLAFSQKKDLLFYTSNKAIKNEEGQKEQFLKITTAIKEGRRWLKDEILDLSWPACNDVHPALSSNEDFLVFASDRPGGYGGMDLYVSYFSGGQWGLPINLGADINTKGNEVFPFVSKEGTLYFSSDGWAGNGGLDVFHAPIDEDGFWLSSSNFGLPFNSPKDDFGFVLEKNGKKGYLASAREGGKGKDDIYCFEFK